MFPERWDAFFEDLEQQFAAGREISHDGLASEQERVRIAGLTLRDRLSAVRTGGRIVIGAASGTHRMRVDAVGADWIAGTEEDHPGFLVARIDALDSVQFAGEERETTLAGGGGDPLERRMTFGFVLRALARRRVAISLGLVRAGQVAGTPMLAGADHVDLALHDAGGAPRGSEVRGVQTIPFRAIAWARTRARSDAGAFSPGSRLGTVIPRTTR